MKNPLETMPEMKHQTIAKLLEDIECEGFDYALNDYDDYHGIKDNTFISLYDEYLSARKRLVEYLGVDA